jgi:hypothetical protein
VSLEYPYRFLAPFGRVSILKWPYLQKSNSTHATCSVKCPNQPKMLRLNPNFLGTFTTPPVTYSLNFTPIRYTRLQFHSIPRFERSFPSQVPKFHFSSPKFKPSTHFTHIHPYKPIHEVSAQFHVISYLNLNSKPPMALFLVQTPFSRRLTSRSPYLSFSVPYFSVYVFIHISYTYEYVINTCSHLLSFQ